MDSTVSVIVPSYNRPHQLADCLTALSLQSVPVAQVILVKRDTDAEAADVARTFSDGRLHLTVLTVDRPGVIHAMQEGLSAATGDIVALTDDDACPDPDWIAKIQTHFEDQSVIGVGGRDILPWSSPPQKVVGLVTWSGTLIGNHHCGEGPTRPVDVLKGVNCAFRRSAISEIGFDPRLLGHGAQVHWEAGLCLALRRKGATLVYDPELTVHHFPAVRPSGDDRTAFDVQNFNDSTHNGYLVIWEYLSGFRRLAFRVRTWLIGSRSAPGLLIFPFSAAKFGLKEASARFSASRRAEQLARLTSRQSRR